MTRKQSSSLPKATALPVFDYTGKPHRSMVQCSNCEQHFYKQGFYSHAGSRTCELATLSLPIRKKIAENRQRMLKAEKKQLSKTVYNAIVRRDNLVFPDSGKPKIAEFVGLESSITSYVQTVSGDTQEVMQYWWDSWAGKAYFQNRVLHNNPYREFERIQNSKTPL